MQTPVPLQTTFVGMESSAPLEHRVGELVNRLQRSGERVTHCRVSIEPPSGKRRVFCVHAHAQTQHGEFAASNDHDPSGSHADAYVALRDTMDALHRQLVDHRQKGRSRRVA